MSTVLTDTRGNTDKNDSSSAICDRIYKVNYYHIHISYQIHIRGKPSAVSPQGIGVALAATAAQRHINMLNCAVMPAVRVMPFARTPAINLIKQSVTKASLQVPAVPQSRSSTSACGRRVSRRHYLRDRPSNYTIIEVRPPTGFIVCSVALINVAIATT